MRQVLDARMKEVSKTGLGSLHRRADIISPEQESILWNKDLLGSNTHTKMLDTLVFSYGLNFVLRAGQEHRNLRRCHSFKSRLTRMAPNIFFTRRMYQKPIQGD